MAWFASVCLALDGSCVPQSAAALGIHVDSFVHHLYRSEVVDVVAGAITDCSFGVALGSLSSGLAWDGCRCFLGCETRCTAASAVDLALGNIRNDSRCNPGLGCDAIYSARTTPPTRVDRDVGSDPAPSLRHVPDSRSPVAGPWRQSRTHHVCTSPFGFSRRVLGEAVEPRFPSVRPRVDFSSAVPKLGPDTAGFFVFAVSGLIHDLVISLPARGGYGLPTLYFLLQGAGVTVERSRFGKRLRLGQGVRGWCFMMVFLTVPVFGLFHPWFVLRVILPFMRAIHAL